MQKLILKILIITVTSVVFGYVLTSFTFNHVSEAGSGSDTTCQCDSWEHYIVCGVDECYVDGCCDYATCTDMVCVSSGTCGSGYYVCNDVANDRCCPIGSGVTPPPDDDEGGGPTCTPWQPTCFPPSVAGEKDSNGNLLVGHKYIVGGTYPAARNPEDGQSSGAAALRIIKGTSGCDSVWYERENYYDMEYPSNCPVVTMNVPRLSCTWDGWTPTIAGIYILECVTGIGGQYFCEGFPDCEYDTGVSWDYCEPNVGGWCAYVNDDGHYAPAFTVVNVVAPNPPPTCDSMSVQTVTVNQTSGTLPAYVYGVSSEVTAVYFGIGDANRNYTGYYVVGVNLGGGTWKGVIDLAEVATLQSFYVFSVMYSPGYEDIDCGEVKVTRYNCLPFPGCPTTCHLDTVIVPSGICTDYECPPNNNLFPYAPCPEESGASGCVLASTQPNGDCTTRNCPGAQSTYSITATVKNKSSVLGCPTLSTNADNVLVTLTAYDSSGNSKNYDPALTNTSGVVTFPNIDINFNSQVHFTLSKTSGSTSYRSACLSNYPTTITFATPPAACTNTNVTLALEPIPIGPWISVVDGDVFASNIGQSIPIAPVPSKDGFAYTLIDSAKGIGGFALSRGAISTLDNKIYKTNLGGYASSLEGGTPSVPHYDVSLSLMTFDPPSNATSITTFPNPFTVGTVYKMKVTDFNSQVSSNKTYTTNAAGTVVLYITDPDNTGNSVSINGRLTTASQGRLLIVSKRPVNISENVYTALVLFNYPWNTYSITSNPNIMAGIISQDNITVKSKSPTLDYPIMLSTPLVSKGTVDLRRDLGPTNNPLYPAHLVINNYTKYLYDISYLERTHKESLNYTGLRSFDIQFVY